MPNIRKIMDGFRLEGKVKLAREMDRCDKSIFRVNSYSRQSYKYTLIPFTQVHWYMLAQH